MKRESQLSTQTEKQSVNELEERLAELEMEHKQAVEARRKSESQRRSLLENMPNGVAWDEYGFICEELFLRGGSDDEKRG